jgi:hypothetical protein
MAAGQTVKRLLAATGRGRRHAPCGSLVALPVTLTETTTGAQLIVAISGRVTVSFLTGEFSFSGGYTITGRTGRFTGASGAGSAIFSGSSDPVTGAVTITSFSLSGIILL